MLPLEEGRFLFLAFYAYLSLLNVKHFSFKLTLVTWLTDYS